MTDIADLTAMTDPASGDLFHVIDVSSTDARQDRKITRQYLLGYTEYVALLTQTGTDAPTAVDIKNDTGATVTWTRFIAGFYRATFSSNVLVADKVVIIMTGNSVTYIYRGAYSSTNVANIYTGNLSGALVDAALSATPVIIRIYT